MIRSHSVGGVSEQGDVQFAKTFRLIKFLIGYDVTWYLNKVSCIFHECMVRTKTSSSLVRGTLTLSHTIGYGYTRNVVTGTVVKLSVYIQF